MYLRYAAVLLVAAPICAHAQQAADFYSCIEPSRLNAPLTATYAVKGATADYTDVDELAAVEVDGQKLLRITRTRYRDNAMTSVQIMHVTAGTLAQVSYLHNSARTPNDPPLSLVVQRSADGTPGRLTGHSYGKRAVALDTNGQGVLFGNAAEEMLAAAVDWDRCPTVTAMHLNVTDLDLRREITLKRTGESVFTLDGRQLPVHEVEITKAGYSYTVLITKAAPFVVVKGVHTTPSSTKDLIKLTH